jgi:hypothetical protein
MRQADAESETGTPSRGQPIVANFLLFCNVMQMPSQKHARITRPTNCCQLSSILQCCDADAAESETRTPSRGQPIVANFLLFCNMMQMMPSQKHARHHEANHCCQLSSILQYEYEADAESETRTPSRGQPIVAAFLLFCNMR